MAFYGGLLSLGLSVRNPDTLVYKGETARVNARTRGGFMVVAGPGNLKRRVDLDAVLTRSRRI